MQKVTPGSSCRRNTGVLQAPFCVHPKTGNVCVPVDPQKSASFEPGTVPTLQALLQSSAEAAAEVGFRFLAIRGLCRLKQLVLTCIMSGSGAGTGWRRCVVTFGCVASLDLGCRQTGARSCTSAIDDRASCRRPRHVKVWTVRSHSLSRSFWHHWRRPASKR